MGVRGAQHIGARLADELYVIDVAAGAPHQIRVFLPRNRLANSKITHPDVASQPGHNGRRNEGTCDLQERCIPALPPTVKGTNGGGGRPIRMEGRSSILGDAPYMSDIPGGDPCIVLSHNPSYPSLTSPRPTPPVSRRSRTSNLRSAAARSLRCLAPTAPARRR